ncbi:hypothetical protein [Alkalihalobacillus sp. BA299]|uniref:hypothetical protein n=1 Tax=Alkalihalobacillus sp. BA299 TaxID=2815938 RepID=UPI001ADBACF1|nr:hypothetical protein [Alkalihalobacillus sp. BA299]
MTKRKMISFNNDENWLLDHALSQKDLSEYVKKLIRLDIEKDLLKEVVRKPNIYEIYREKMKKTP